MGNLFGGTRRRLILQETQPDDLVAFVDKKFDSITFDEGGSGKKAKIFYLTRIEKLKDKIKKNAILSKQLMDELNDLLKDLLSHRHTYNVDYGYVAYGNSTILSDNRVYTNKISSYPAQLNNQILVAEPTITGGCLERWFSRPPDLLDPEVLEMQGIMKYSRVVTSNYFNYSRVIHRSISGRTNKIPTEVSGNMGCIFDFNLNFTNSDLGLTKYFAIKHNDAVTIYFNGSKVYAKDENNGPAFYVPITADLINKPIKCQIIWLGRDYNSSGFSGSVSYKLEFGWSNSLGYVIENYTSIPGSYISSLTPINSDENQFSNRSFYLFVHYLNALFNHNHRYTDGGFTDYTYNQIKEFLSNVQAVGSAYVPIVLRSGELANNPSSYYLENKQLASGAGYLFLPGRYIQGDDDMYIEVNISPFTVSV
jgi:hypothetical protein